MLTTSGPSSYLWVIKKCFLCVKRVIKIMLKQSTPTDCQRKGWLFHQIQMMPRVYIYVAEDGEKSLE